MVVILLSIVIIANSNIDTLYQQIGWILSGIIGILLLNNSNENYIKDMNIIRRLHLLIVLFLAGPFLFTIGLISNLKIK